MNNQKPKKSLVRRHDNFGFVFLIPWMIGFTVFFLYPFLRSVLLSVQKVEFLPGGGFSTTFVGIENYITALTRDEKFLPLAAGSVLDLFINVPVCLVFSFFVAVLLRQKFFGNALVKAVFFLPVILGTGVFLSVQTETAAVSGMSLDSAMEEGVAFGGLFPGEVEMAHQADEYVTLDNFNKNMKIFAYAIVRLCAQA